MSVILEKLKEYPYMTQTRFYGKAMFSGTQHMRTVDTYALNINDCIAALRAKGYTDPFEINEMPSEPATESQLAFAEDLGLSYPPDISKKDMTFLISKKVDNDGDPKPGLLEYATNRNMVVSKYMGKKALYDIIFDSLEGRDKVAFFLFCVYRYSSDDRYENLDTHQHKEAFYALAEELVLDDKFMKSMNKYEGSALRYFGTLKVEPSNADSFNAQGGSTDTIAYKRATQALQAVYSSMPFRKFKKINGNRPANNTPNQSQKTSTGNYGASTYSGQQPSAKWYEKTPYIILLLWLVFPVGAFFMWKYAKWSPIIKMVVTVALCLFWFQTFMNIPTGTTATASLVIGISSLIHP